MGISYGKLRNRFVIERLSKLIAHTDLLVNDTLLQSFYNGERTADATLLSVPVSRSSS